MSCLVLCSSPDCVLSVFTGVTFQISALGTESSGLLTDFKKSEFTSSILTSFPVVGSVIVFRVFETQLIF